MEGFTTGPQVQAPVRVVRSHETRPVRRQLDGPVEPEISQGYWGTTLPAPLASTGAVVQMGHRRWGIENEGFNERGNPCHANHVYRHEPTAMLVFWLLTQRCLNVFTAFFRRNLKLAARAALRMLPVARLLLSELHRPQARVPTGLPARRDTNPADAPTRPPQHRPHPVPAPNRPQQPTRT